MDQKRDLFADLASKLDGDQLARFASHLDSRRDQAAFGDAVATHASDADKLEFIREARSETTPDGLFARNDRVDPDAVGVARVLDSLKDNPRAYHAAMRSLTPAQFEAVMRAGGGR